MAKSKVTLSLIANKTSRRATFKKRKRGVLKKLNELVTLCGVKGCAVINNCQDEDQNSEAWPSKEGVEEVFSKFMEYPEDERTKKMYDQVTYTVERIRKENEKRKKLHDENREFEMRNLMFDLLKGKKMMEYPSHDPSVFQDLGLSIDRYLDKLHHRIQVLEVNGESISFPPLAVAAVDAPHLAVGDVNPPAVGDVNPAAVDASHPAVGDVNPAAVDAPHPAVGYVNPAAVGAPHPAVGDVNPIAVDAPHVNPAAVGAPHPSVGDVNPAAVSDVAAVTTALGFFDHIPPYDNMYQQELAQYQVPTYLSDYAQYQNMNQQELAQYQVPTNFSDHTQYQNMNYQEQFQYQEPGNVYDQNQHILYGWNQDMSSDLNHNLSESLNPYPNQWMAQPRQMSSNQYPNQWISTMEDSYYRYHQLPTTSHIPSFTTTTSSTTTTTTVDLSAPNTNNSPWPTRFGLE